MGFDTNMHFRLKEKLGPDQLERILSGKFIFTADPLISEKWTFYDTYDWRLFNESLVLRHDGRTTLLNNLSDSKPIDALPTASIPKFAWDLPESPLRESLESIIKMRALLPLVEVETSFTHYRILNADQKTVARLVYSTVQTIDGENKTSLATYLSLQPVRGYSKYTRKLAKEFGRMPRVSSLIQNIFTRALKKAGKEPGSYSSKFTLQLKPQKRSHAAAKAILRYLLKVMKANEEGIKADIDTEFLHDYRIAIRRTRSALSQIKNVFPVEETEYFRQSFKYLGQFTNELRDLDVYLLSENDFEALLPEGMRADIVPLFDYLRTLRQKALEKVKITLSSPEYAGVLGEWEEFLHEPPSPKGSAANAAVPIIDLARKRIFKHYRRVIEEGEVILTYTQDELLHALRVECKKLRYLMEFFASLFPEKKMARLIKQLKNLQDNLGDFNDLSVQQEYLMQMAEELPMDDPRSRKALVATGYLVENLSYKQNSVRENFAGTFTEFASPANQKLFRQLFATKGKKVHR